MHSEMAHQIFVYSFLPQAGINGATCVMVLHKITFPMTPNMAYNQFCPSML